MAANRLAPSRALVRQALLAPRTLGVLVGLAALTSGLLAPAARAEDAPTTAPAPPTMAPDTPGPSLAPANDFISSAPPLAPEKPEPTATPTAEPLKEASKEGSKDAAKDASPKEALKEPEKDVAPVAEPTPDANVAATPADPNPSIPADDARAENVVEAKHERGVPGYQLTRPAWAIQITGSFNALGGNPVEPSQTGDTPTRALEFQAEYQPPFLQSFGVIGFGPSASILPITPVNTATGNVVSLWSAGGQIRYQARFWREQPIVPMAGFEAQYMTYHFLDGNMGGTTLTGPFVGAMFLLNIIEQSAAAEMYINTSVSRSYLVAELKSMSGSDSVVSVSGQSIFFGLRFEF